MTVTESETERATQPDTCPHHRPKSRTRAAESHVTNTGTSNLWNDTNVATSPLPAQAAAARALNVQSLHVTYQEGDSWRVGGTENNFKSTVFKRLVTAEYTKRPPLGGKQLQTEDSVSLRRLHALLSGSRALFPFLGIVAALLKFYSSVATPRLLPKK